MSFLFYDTFIFWNHTRYNQPCLLEPATTKTLNFEKKKHEYYHVPSTHVSAKGHSWHVFCIGFHEALREGIKFPVLYNFCDISKTWRTKSFKLCIASIEYLSLIWAKCGGHSSIGDVRVTTWFHIVSRNHAFSDFTSHETWGCMTFRTLTEFLTHVGTLPTFVISGQVCHVTVTSQSYIALST